MTKTAAAFRALSVSVTVQGFERAHRNHRIVGGSSAAFVWCVSYYLGVTSARTVVPGLVISGRTGAPSGPAAPRGPAEGRMPRERQPDR